MKKVLIISFLAGIILLAVLIIRTWEWESMVITTKQEAEEEVLSFLRTVDADDYEHYKGLFDNRHIKKLAEGDEELRASVSQPAETDGKSLQAWDRILSQAYDRGLINDTAVYGKNKEQYYYSVVSIYRKGKPILFGPSMTFVINRKTGEIEFFYEQF